MLKQMDVNEQTATLERVEGALHKMQTLRDKIAELINQCEELKKRSLEAKNDLITCGICEQQITPGQEVMMKDQTGLRRYYHMKCFRELW
jgi:hypothetical protein